jgi:hypothetical protein
MSFAPTRSTVMAAALAAVFVAAPEAQARPAHPAPDACGYVGTRIFEPWQDRFGYVLTPDGGFEDGGQGWPLTGGAAVVEGNETFQLGGPADHRSLSLPPGSSATSPPICVARHDGAFRLMTRSAGSRARLRVDVTYASGRHAKRSVLGAHAVWQPSRRLAVAIGRAKHGKLPTSVISIRFTPVSGTWQIDDLYLDPRLRG